MLQTAKRAGESRPAETPPHERYLEAFRWMLQTRIFEEKLTSLYRGGMITGGVYIGRGPGGGQHGVRFVFAEGRCLRAAHPRSGGTRGVRRAAART